MAKYIYSTLSANKNFGIRTVSKGGVSIKKGAVCIKGGANIADKRTLITPKGVLTTISDAEYEAIKDLPTFKRQVEKGFLKVETKSTDAEKVAKNMTAKDAAAQKTKEDLKKKSKANEKEDK